MVKSVQEDESLYWDPFVSLFDELDTAAVHLPSHLAEKVRRNHKWFIESVNGFKQQNETSKKALESDEIKFGSNNNRVSVKTEFREIALKVSQLAGLDEVQSYILVDRCSNSSIDKKDLVQHVLMRYYIERQCLLKCIRRIFVHALYSNDIINSQAMILINENLQTKLISLIQDLLSSSFSIKSDMEYTILWIEETLIETNIILDILFLSFYDNLSSCNLNQWKSLYSLFKGMLLNGSYDMNKMAVSIESTKSFSHAKSQLLFILIETLDLENLLKLVHDQIPFSEAICAFSLNDIQEIDAELAQLSDELAIESGPLILSWAVHLSLLSSLPNSSLELEHVNYVRLAFEYQPFDYLLEIISSQSLTESDGPVSGFMSIIRTLISAFFASYELSQSTGDDQLNLILTILCQIYRGEESLCMQFWDKDSFVDGPIRSLLFSLEREYPFQKDDFIRFLCAVSEGSWPSQCVYSYLEKLTGMTTPYKSSSGSHNLRLKELITLQSPLGVPGVQSLLVPSGTHGYVFRLLEGNQNQNGNLALVRWEFSHSGIIVLLLNLAECFYYNRHEECYHIIDLISRMVKSNKAICYSLLNMDKVLYDQGSKLRGQIENDFRIDIVKVICTAIFNLVHESGDINLITNCFSILTELFKCNPSRVLQVAIESNIFSTEITPQSNGSWILSTGLSRLLLVSCEQNIDCSNLIISVLDFISQVVKKGPIEAKIISPLIIFVLQYVLINHMNWKYTKNSHWKTTLKVFELMKDCIRKYSVQNTIGSTIREIIFYDSSILNIIWRILIIISTQSLQNEAELKDGENMKLVLSTLLEIIQSILNELLLQDEGFSSLSPFISLFLSPNSKPISFSSVAISLFSFFSNPEIQIGSAKILSSLCLIGSKFQSQFIMDNLNLIFDHTQISKLRETIYDILTEDTNQDENIKITILNLLTSISSYQPALFSSLSLNLNSKETISLIDPILKLLEGSKYLINSSPDLLSSILNLLKALWENGIQYTDILEKFKNSKNFWDILFLSFSPNRDKTSIEIDNGDKHLSSRFLCQSLVLEITSYELFFQEKILSNEKERDQNAKEAFNKFFTNPYTEELIKSYIGNTNNDIFHQVKISISICILDIIRTIFYGNKNKGSLSVSFLKKIEEIYSKLITLPSFSLSLSSEKEQMDLLTKLQNYLINALNSQEIQYGPFNDLSNFLSDLDIFNKENQIYDILEIRNELGFDMWAYLSEWKDFAELAEKMFLCMKKVNFCILVRDSKLTALNAFLMAFIMYKETSGSTVSEAFIQSSIKCICKSLELTLNNLLISQTLNPEKQISTFTVLSIQTELLLTLIKLPKFPQNLIPLIKQIASSALRTLTEVNSLNPNFIKTLKLFLLIQLEIYIQNPTGEDDNNSTGEDNNSTEFNTTNLILAPLCSFLENDELANLALASLDLTLKGNFVNTNILFPILQKHLPIQTLLQKFITKKENQNDNISILLNFFLTLSSTNQGAKLLYSTNFLSFLKPFMNDLFSQNGIFTSKNIYLLTLGFSIINSLIHFTSTDPFSSDIISFVFEKSEILSIYLSTPEFPTNDKKRPRLNNNNTQITLPALTLISQYIFLLYTLSKFKHSLAFNAGLNSRLIHLLSFISKGNISKLPFCPPSQKESDKSTGIIIKTKKGWFGNGSDSTRFEETVGVRIYEIALGVLSYLCNEAELAIQRAEEIRFVDLVNSPDLPSPQILHSIQDQVIGILVDLLIQRGKEKSETERICHLLIQLIERSIYMELCVSYLCDIRPVLGRAEDFSNQIKPLLNSMKEKKEFRGYVRSLNEVIGLLYPELLHGGNLL